MIYKYNFRFNAIHNTAFDLDITKKHTHTFEILCYVKQSESNYDLVENQINNYLIKYRGSYLNDMMVELPTIENIAELFYKDINKIAKNFTLIRLELSDKPVQTYIIGEEIGVKNDSI